MDKRLGTHKRPELSDLRAWFAMAPPLLAASIHWPFEQWFADIKSTGVTLVYLRKPKELLPKHLSQEQPCGKKRPEPDQLYSVQSYDTLDEIFKTFADYTVNCSNKDIPTVAAEVKGILEKNASPPHV